MLDDLGIPISLLYMHTYTYIMTKIVSLTNEVYSTLKRMKKNKSFSEEIKELIVRAGTKGDVKELRKFMGVWSKEDAKAFSKEITAARKSSKHRYFA